MDNLRRLRAEQEDALQVERENRARLERARLARAYESGRRQALRSYRDAFAHYYPGANGPIRSIVTSRMSSPMPGRTLLSPHFFSSNYGSLKEGGEGGMESLPSLSRTRWARSEHFPKSSHSLYPACLSFLKCRQLLPFPLTGPARCFY